MINPLYLQSDIHFYSFSAHPQIPCKYIVGNKMTPYLIRLKFRFRRTIFSKASSFSWNRYFSLLSDAVLSRNHLVGFSITGSMGKFCPYWFLFQFSLFKNVPYMLSYNTNNSAICSRESHTVSFTKVASIFVKPSSVVYINKFDSCIHTHLLFSCAMTFAIVNSPCLQTNVLLSFYLIYFMPSIQ